MLRNFRSLSQAARSRTVASWLSTDCTPHQRDVLERWINEVHELSEYLVKGILNCFQVRRLAATLYIYATCTAMHLLIKLLFQKKPDLIDGPYPRALDSNSCLVYTVAWNRNRGSSWYVGTVGGRVADRCCAQFTYVAHHNSHGLRCRCMHTHTCHVLI